jgi:hypothetical protein
MSESAEAPTAAAAVSQPSPPAPAPVAPAEEVRPPRFVGRPATVLLVIVFAGLAGLAVYVLYGLWPVAPSAASDTRTVSVFGWEATVRTEKLLFAVVAVAGALGGFLHALRSLGWYIGSRHLAWNWVPYYLALPLLGAGLAVVLYVVIRGGFFTIDSNTSETNPYGFAAVAALVGLFSQQALEMLKRVAEVVFTRAPKGRDQAPEAVRTGSEQEQQGGES